ncbi:hypothetical protein LTR10_006418 [Elasticomyces elasticus]|jgi:hypothetical protein|nr:hypothetical protein LTR10_006418 [Elasticomyces elasticus]
MADHSYAYEDPNEYPSAQQPRIEPLPPDEESEVAFLRNLGIDIEMEEGISLYNQMKVLAMLCPSEEFRR